MRKGALLLEVLVSIVMLGMVAGGSVPDVTSLTDRLDEGQQRLLAGGGFGN